MSWRDGPSAASAPWRLRKRRTQPLASQDWQAAFSERVVAAAVTAAVTAVTPGQARPVQAAPAPKPTAAPPRPTQAPQPLLAIEDEAAVEASTSKAAPLSPPPGHFGLRRWQRAKAPPPAVEAGPPSPAQPAPRGPTPPPRRRSRSRRRRLAAPEGPRARLTEAAPEEWLGANSSGSVRESQALADALGAAAGGQLKVEGLVADEYQVEFHPSAEGFPEACKNFKDGFYEKMLGGPSCYAMDMDDGIEDSSEFVADELHDWLEDMDPPPVFGCVRDAHDDADGLGPDGDADAFRKFQEVLPEVPRFPMLGGELLKETDPALHEVFKGSESVAESNLSLSGGTIVMEVNKANQKLGESVSSDPWQQVLVANAQVFLKSEQVQAARQLATYKEYELLGRFGDIQVVIQRPCINDRLWRPHRASILETLEALVSDCGPSILEELLEVDDL
ncbi:unnamed protein product [Prorocentrum cordatum]|uniref:Uncharacterized protein n=1 Tax=Prorocentrum cordatum TaxID=2364126 RepID=A0ABN9Y5R5_9DINO|nr:unnamed protein product [Polarella glacialis]